MASATISSIDVKRGFIGTSLTNKYQGLNNPVLKIVKDERRTSNAQRRTSNNDVASLHLIIWDRGLFEFLFNFPLEGPRGVSSLLLHPPAPLKGDSIFDAPYKGRFYLSEFEVSTGIAIVFFSLNPD